MKKLPVLNLTGKLNLSNSKIEHKHSTKGIDLNRFHNTLIKSKKDIEEKCLFGNVSMNTSHLLYELFNLGFLRSFNMNLTSKLDRFIGYSIKYNSLTISILDKDNDVKSIAIRKAFDKESKEVKWKSYGSKTFIPYKITGKSDIYIAVGMAEYVLFELMDLDYILLQSDSMYKHISEKLINQCLYKNIIILKENDESYQRLILNLEKMFFESNVYVIDFEKLLNKKLSKGYDFRDFCNEKQNIGVIYRELEQYKENIKGKRCN